MDSRKTLMAYFCRQGFSLIPELIELQELPDNSASYIFYNKDKENFKVIFSRLFDFPLTKSCLDKGQIGGGNLAMRKNIAVLSVIFFALSLFYAIPKATGQTSVLPTNFNPLTATPGELEKYRFPPRPKEQKLLKAWETAMEQAKYYIKPKQIFSSPVHGPMYMDNWSGYIVQNLNRTDHVFAEWVQPAYSGRAQPSFWVGIGRNMVVQAGADSNAGFFRPLEFWVEDYPDNTVWEANPAVHEGDTLYVDISYQGSTSTAFLENVTTGQYTSVSFATPYYDGSSADFIQEDLNRTYGSWGTTTFYGAGLRSSGGAGFFTDFAYKMIIATNNGTSTGSFEAIPSYLPEDGSFKVSSY